MSADHAESTFPRLETTINIPLSALNKLRITCQHCKTAMELSLSKNVIEAMKEKRALCVYCGKVHHTPTTDLSVIIEFWDNVGRLLNWQTPPGANIEFVVQAEPPESILTHKH